MQKITFILYNPSFLLCKGLSSVIEKIPNTQIIQQIESINELDEVLRHTESDFLLLDIDILKSNKTTKIIFKKYKKTQLIAFSKDTDITTSPLDFVEIIFLTDTHKEILKKINRVLGNNDSNKSTQEIPDAISKRETDILKLIALGFSNKETADKLFISTHTVVAHRKNITRKLGIKTVPGLTIYAILNNIININDTQKT